ncbi:MAG: anti-sigma factor family protein [Candidatus Binatia bacterium]
MSCTELEEKLDLFIDQRLPDEETRALRLHIGDCESCEKIVTAFQETRALLSTAVTEMVAAVGVSGLWEKVEASLEGGGEFESRSDPLVGRVGAWLRETFTWRAGFALGGTAVAAAALILAFAGTESSHLQPQTQGRRIAQRIMQRHAESYRGAARVDALSGSSEYSVSTWVQPRTNTRVIWLAHSGSFTVQDADY